jgi:hypothetical protein
MASTKKFIPRDKMLGGMSSLPAHLIGDQRWYRAFNVRFDRGTCKQIPRKVLVNNLLQNSKYTTLALLTIPTGIRGTENVLALTERTAYRFNYSSDWEPMSGIVPFNVAPTYQRWATVFWNGRWYFTNTANHVHYTNGDWIEANGEEPQPAGKYMAVFFDHLVVAHCGFGGNMDTKRFRWSALNRFGLWDPKRSNEADYYDILEGSEINGMAVLGDAMYVYSDAGITVVEYKGLPTIMYSRFVPTVSPTLTNSLVDCRGQHYFIDIVEKDFFMFNGELPQAIGDQIADFFFTDIHTAETLRQKTWGYYDIDAQEVVWVYVSKASLGDFDRCVIYNKRTKAWSFGSVENVHSFCPAVKTFRAVNQLPGTVLDLGTTPVSSLGVLAKSWPKLWGSAYSSILREADPSDPELTLLPQALPYLETGDMIYKDVQTMHEIDTLAVQAKSSTGIQVQISTRNQLSDPVEWVNVKQIWRGDEKEGRLSVPRNAGRIYRYRFNPVDISASVASKVRQSFVIRAEPGFGETPPGGGGGGGSAIVQPDVYSGLVSYFNGGVSFPAGTYTIRYLDGSLVYNIYDDAAHTQLTDPEFYAWVVNYAYNGSCYHAKHSNGLVVEPVTAPSTVYGSLAESESEPAPDGFWDSIITHAGGPIGVFLNDDPYWDNFTSKAPRFQLIIP